MKGEEIMAGLLFKKELVVMETAQATKEQVIGIARNYVNSFQNAPANKNGDGSYKDYFFVDCFDSRTKELFRIYSDACESKYQMVPNQDGVILYNLLAGAGGGNGEGVDLTDIYGTLTNHTQRIEALEMADDGSVFIIE